MPLFFFAASTIRGDGARLGKLVAPFLRVIVNKIAAAASLGNAARGRAEYAFQRWQQSERELRKTVKIKWVIV